MFLIFFLCYGLYPAAHLRKFTVYSTYCQEVKGSELLRNRKQLYFTWQVREVIKRPKQSQKSMLFIDPWISWESFPLDKLIFSYAWF